MIVDLQRIAFPIAVPPFRHSREKAREYFKLSTTNLPRVSPFQCISTARLPADEGCAQGSLLAVASCRWLLLECRSLSCSVTQSDGGVRTNIAGSRSAKVISQSGVAVVLQASYEPAKTVNCFIEVHLAESRTVISDERKKTKDTYVRRTLSLSIRFYQTIARFVQRVECFAKRRDIKTGTLRQ